MIPNLSFDSEEERLFCLYLEELKDAGFILSYDFQPEPFILSDTATYEWKKRMKTKIVDKESTLLREHIYTADFEIYWDHSAEGIFYDELDTAKLGLAPFVAQEYNSFIEIKPSFDANNMQRLFTINQKWVYEKYKIYIQKITPVSKKSCLFSNTFVPKDAMFTKIQRKPKKYNFQIRTLEEYVEGMR